MRKFTAAALCLALATASPIAISAQAPACMPVAHWATLPKAVRASLVAATGPIAAEGERFNATDVIERGVASNRFLTACRREHLWAVAIERGGRGYRVEVFHYSDGKIVRQWSVIPTASGTQQLNLLTPPEPRHPLAHGQR